MVPNRLIISTLLMIYLVVSAMLLHRISTADAIVADALYGCVSIGFFLHMLAWPQTCHPRRVIGMVVDIGALTYCSCGRPDDGGPGRSFSGSSSATASASA